MYTGNVCMSLSVRRLTNKLITSRVAARAQLVYSYYAVFAFVCESVTVWEGVYVGPGCSVNGSRGGGESAVLLVRF